MPATPMPLYNGPHFARDFQLILTPPGDLMALPPKFYRRNTPPRLA